MTLAEIRRLVVAISGHPYTPFGHCQGPVCRREFTLGSAGIRSEHSLSGHWNATSIYRTRSLYVTQIAFIRACYRLVFCPGAPVMFASVLFVSSGSASEGLNHKSSFSRFAKSQLTPNRHLRALWSG